MLISAGTVKAILKDNRCGQRYALRADLIISDFAECLFGEYP